jgi:uncharacterized protein YjdB
VTDAFGCDNAPAAVRWRSSNTSVVSVDPLSGLVRGVSEGTSTVVARMLADSTVAGAAIVNVAR